MMRKIRARKGFTLVELLVALMILTLLTAAVATGTRTGAMIHRDARFASESALLAESLGNALGDVLRYAVYDGESGRFTNEGYAYLGDDLRITETGGRLILEGTGGELPLLGEKSYTNMRIQADSFALTYADGLFTGGYTIESTWGDPPFTKEITFAFRSLDG